MVSFWHELIWKESKNSGEQTCHSTAWVIPHRPFPSHWHRAAQPELLGDAHKHTNTPKLKAKDWFPTFLRGDNRWQVIGDVLLPLLCILTPQLGELQDIVLADRERGDLMCKSDRFNVVDVIFQLMQVHPHELEGISYVVQNGICAAIWNRTNQQENNGFTEIQVKKFSLKMLWDYGPPAQHQSERRIYCPTVLAGLLSEGFCLEPSLCFKSHHWRAALQETNQAPRRKQQQAALPGNTQLTPHDPRCRKCTLSVWNRSNITSQPRRGTISVFWTVFAERKEKKVSSYKKTFTKYLPTRWNLQAS